MRYLMNKLFVPNETYTVTGKVLVLIAVQVDGRKIGRIRLQRIANGSFKSPLQKVLLKASQPVLFVNRLEYLNISLKNVA